MSAREGGDSISNRPNLNLCTSSDFYGRDGLEKLAWKLLRRPHADIAVAHIAVMSTLTAYELQRLANIRANQSVLASLGLAGESPLGLPPKVPPATGKRHRPRAPAASVARAEPSRKSSRIAALPAPAVYVADELPNGRIIVNGAGDSGAVAKHEQEAPTPPWLPDDWDEAPQSEGGLHVEERVAYASLRAEKNRIARELDTAAYHVAQNRALMAMVRCLPETREALLDCWGWGEAKTREHGDRLLGVLRSHLDELRAARDARAESVAHAAEAVMGADDAEVLSAAEDDDEAEAAADVGAPPLPLSQDDLFAHEKAAFEALLQWKRARARELGFNDPCVICHNRTRALASVGEDRTRPSPLALHPLDPTSNPPPPSTHGGLAAAAPYCVDGKWCVARVGSL